MKFAAYAIILLAVFNVNNALALAGSNFTMENIWTGFWCTISICSTNNQTITNEATVTIEAYGYNPNNIVVKAGSSVRLHLKNTNGAGCVQAFTIPSLGIQKVVPVGTSDTVSFVAPSRPGKLAFMCSMGMFRGTIDVI